jgi:Raf kinase inhibitor-like YbhB/YbcL family protein
MKKLNGFVAALVLFVSPLAMADAFKVSSDTIKQGGKISMDQVFNGFGCTGKNISPDLKWSGEPKDTKAFAVTVYDPDAPTGSGWWHWVAVNIPADVHSLSANAGSAGGEMPKGTIQTQTDFGKPGYGGPCPPPGKPHHYIFTVFALKAPLQVEPAASGAMVGYFLNQNKLASAKIVSTFTREAPKN